MSPNYELVLGFAPLICTIKVCNNNKISKNLVYFEIGKISKSLVYFEIGKNSKSLVCFEIVETEKTDESKSLEFGITTTIINHHHHFLLFFFVLMCFVVEEFCLPWLALLACLRGEDERERGLLQPGVYS
jgi:hypothetical protein